MDKVRVRLDRALAYIGFGKRSEMKQLILAEQVLVNNKIVKTNAYVFDEDVIDITHDDVHIVFKMKLEAKDSKILLAVTPILKESVKYYSC